MSQSVDIAEHQVVIDAIKERGPSCSYPTALTDAGAVEQSTSSEEIVVTNL